MPSARHHELPARVDIEYYRRQAKALLKAYRTGDDEATARVEEIVGHRDGRPVQLGNAQFVIAREHGFRSWAEFSRNIKAATDPARPVQRGFGDQAQNEARVSELMASIVAGDESAFRRLQAYVPRYADVPATALRGVPIALGEARLVIAREYGFPTWRDLIHLPKNPRVR